jgi:hypothetical protein
MRCLCKRRLASSTLTPWRNRHELLRHQGADRLIEVLLEPDVASREDSDRLLALHDRDAADVVLAHDLEREREETATDGPSLGPRIIPLSARFTRSTLARLRLDPMFLWMMPTPPSRAIVMAARLSVTESIAADRMGMFKSSPRQSRVRTSTSLGSTSLYAGASRTSSNVRHSLSLSSSSMSLYSATRGRCEPTTNGSVGVH